MDQNKISIAFHNVDSSEAMKVIIEEKLNKLLRVHEKNLTRIDFTLSMENPKESTNKELFKSLLHIHGKMKKEFHFDEINEDPRTTVNSVINKAVESLKKDF